MRPLWPGSSGTCTAPDSLDLPWLEPSLKESLVAAEWQMTGYPPLLKCRAAHVRDWLLRKTSEKNAQESDDTQEESEKPEVYEST